MQGGEAGTRREMGAQIDDVNHGYRDPGGRRVPDVVRR